MDDQYNAICGKLHLIQNTSVLTNEPAAPVVACTNQEEQIPWVLSVTTRQREKYLIRYFCKQKYFIA